MINKGIHNISHIVEKQLADRIKYLIENPPEMKKMGAYGRKLVEEEFASDKMAERMLQVFQSEE